MCFKNLQSWFILHKWSQIFYNPKSGQYVQKALKKQPICCHKAFFNFTEIFVLGVEKINDRNGWKILSFLLLVCITYSFISSRRPIAPGKNDNILCEHFLKSQIKSMVTKFRYIVEWLAQISGFRSLSSESGTVAEIGLPTGR